MFKLLNYSKTKSKEFLLKKKLRKIILKSLIMTSHGKQPAHRVIIDDVYFLYDVTLTGIRDPRVWSCCSHPCWGLLGTFCGGSGAFRTSATVALVTGGVALVTADPSGVLDAPFDLVVPFVLVGSVAALGVEIDYHLN